ncbi:hypothetical protein HDV04_005707 [Boothiomyces sp. JEL0838]|nr:hypothetical protein HDV04_005707 [Boothiomyces sp. JEL0838]
MNEQEVTITDQLLPTTQSSASNPNPKKVSWSKDVLSVPRKFSIFDLAYLQAFMLNSMIYKLLLFFSCFDSAPKIYIPAIFYKDFLFLIVQLYIGHYIHGMEMIVGLKGVLLMLLRLVQFGYLVQISLCSSLVISQSCPPNFSILSNCWSHVDEYSILFTRKNGIVLACVFLVYVNLFGVVLTMNVLSSAKKKQKMLDLYRKRRIFLLFIILSVVVPVLWIFPLKFPFNVLAENGLVNGIFQSTNSTLI